MGIVKLVYHTLPLFGLFCLLSMGIASPSLPQPSAIFANLMRHRRGGIIKHGFSSSSDPLLLFQGQQITYLSVPPHPLPTPPSHQCSLKRQSNAVLAVMQTSLIKHMKYQISLNKANVFWHLSIARLCLIHHAVCLLNQTGICWKKKLLWLRRQVVLGQSSVKLYRCQVGMSKIMQSTSCSNTGRDRGGAIVAKNRQPSIVFRN